MLEEELQGVVENPEEVLSLSSKDIVGLLLGIKKGWKDNFHVKLGLVPYIMVLGDLHGDFYAMKKLLRRFLDDEDVFLVALGDYTDRSRTPGGSVVVALTMLALRKLYPERVVLLQGNHENYYLFPFAPYDLPQEIEEVWGRDKDAIGILYVLSSIMVGLPVMARAECGVLFTHGGLLKEEVPLKKNLTHREVENLVGLQRYREIMYGLLWGGPKGYARHVVAPGANYSEKDLEAFLKRLGGVVHVRGHDPYLNGRFLFSQRDITLTSFGEGGLYCIFEADSIIERETIRSRMRLYPTIDGA